MTLFGIAEDYGASGPQELGAPSYCNWKNRLESRSDDFALCHSSFCHASFTHYVFGTKRRKTY